MKIPTSLLTVTAGLLLSSVGGLHAGMTVTSINSADTATTATTLTSLGLNTSANVFTVESNGNERNVRNDGANTMTFQVASGFTLGSIYIEYQASNSTYAAGTVTLSIYSVSDVNATSTGAYPNALGTALVSGQFTTTATADGGLGLTNSTSVSQVLKFDFSSLNTSLAATTGTAGYALQFTTDQGTTPIFAWQSTFNNFYAGGREYDSRGDDGTGKDYTLAITAVPEPHEYAIAITALLGVAIFIRRRTQA